jgi:hypothetical protein
MAQLRAKPGLAYDPGRNDPFMRTGWSDWSHQWRKRELLCSREP